VPTNIVMVALPVGGRPSPVWGGIEIGAGEMLTLGPGERLHSRADRPSGWGAIHVPAQDLAQYGRAVHGAELAVPPGAAHWRPPPAAARLFRHFYGAAIRMAEARSGALVDIEAAHGLEQQLIHAVIECLATGRGGQEPSPARRHRHILAGFEDLLQAQSFPRMTEICAALRVSERLLRESCKKHLGIGPSRYRRLRRMQQVHR